MLCLANRANAPPELEHMDAEGAAGSAADCQAAGSGCTLATEEYARWADLSSSILEIIFDAVLRAPMPHPEYLPGKVCSSCSCMGERTGMMASR